MSDNKKVSYKDLIFKAQFIPYLIREGNKTLRLNNNKISKYIIKKKLKIIEIIIRLVILSEYKIRNYKFDTKKKLINMDLTSKNIYGFSKRKYEFWELKLDLDEIMLESYGSPKELMGDIGPDTWMEGPILLIEEGEIDKYGYEFGIALKKIKYKIKK